MTQVEALRLAMQEVPFEKLTRRDVLENGFFKIKNLDTGDISSTPLTYGPGEIEGVDQIRIDQVQKGKVVKVGTLPIAQHLYAQITIIPGAHDRSPEILVESKKKKDKLESIIFSGMGSSLRGKDDSH